MLKAQNIDDKRIDSIIKVTDFTEKKLDKDGKFEHECDLVESIKNEWKDFVVTTENRGAPVSLPPANTGKAITKEEIMKIKDTAEKKQAMLENLIILSVFIVFCIGRILIKIRGDTRRINL